VAALLLLASLGRPAWLAAQEERIGFVLEMEGAGRWVAVGDARRPLKVGGSVRAGEVVRNDAPRSTDYIVLVGQGEGRPAIRLACDPPDPCRRGRSLAELAPPSPSLAVRVVTAVMALLESEPDTYAVFGSRGGGARPHEQVIAVADGRADLLPALAGAAPGLYQVRLTPVRQEDRSGFGTAEEEVRIAPGAPGAVWISDLPAGLYELEVAGPGAEAAALGERAWILATPASAHQETAQRFAEAVALIESWGGGVGSEAARSFLRAYLYHLAFPAAARHD